MDHFLTDAQTLRQRARPHIGEGAVTSGYRADRETVLKLLNESLASEIVIWQEAARHYEHSEQSAEQRRAAEGGQLLKVAG